MQPSPETFGGRLRMRRLLADMSRQELADALGVSFETIRLWEEKGREPGRPALCNLALVFKLTPLTFTEFVCPDLLKQDAA